MGEAMQLVGIFWVGYVAEGGDEGFVWEGGFGKRSLFPEEFFPEVLPVLLMLPRGRRFLSFRGVRFFRLKLGAREGFWSFVLRFGLSFPTNSNGRRI